MLLYMYRNVLNSQTHTVENTAIRTILIMQQYLLYFIGTSWAIHMGHIARSFPLQRLLYCLYHIIYTIIDVILLFIIFYYLPTCPFTKCLTGP